MSDMNEYNLNFKTELNKLDDCYDNREVCLISGAPLTKSHITLTCSHKFNYIPLFNDIVKQKKIRRFNNNDLEINQFRCPYCRIMQNEVLPYILTERNERINGVNSPISCRMKHTIICEWIGLKGTHKGVKCKNDANYIGEKSYCSNHYK